MIGDVLRDILVHLGLLQKKHPIDSVAAFNDFLATRASFISQKKLYEYVKTRMGISYPKMFQDQAFIESLNIAKWHVYAACMSDLGMWMGAQIHAAGASAEEAAYMAKQAFDHVVADRFHNDEFTGSTDELVEAFHNRVALADWNALAEGENAFSLSPDQLVHWAPISDELKKYDVEIVLNSLRFAWLTIRDEYRKLIRPDAVLADWRGNHAAPKV